MLYPLQLIYLVCLLLILIIVILVIFIINVERSEPLGLSAILNAHYYYPVPHQLYADDTQIYSCSCPSEISATMHNME